MCMMFYRRDTHVAEIQMGTPAGTVADACAMSNFDINKLSYITLLGTELIFFLFIKIILGCPETYLINQSICLLWFDGVSVKISSDRK